MEQATARLRRRRRGRRRPAEVVLVHASGVTLRGADDNPMAFRSGSAAAEFAAAFLCEPHRVVRRPASS